jgi:predicted Zn finger-like uncharacterized protein
MYTQCPHCWSILAIRAEALRVGRSKARCGHCLGAFDVLETLSDTLAELLASRRSRSSENRFIAGKTGPPKSTSADSMAEVVQKRGPPALGAPPVTPPKAAPVEALKAGDAKPTDVAQPALRAQDQVPEVLREELEAAGISQPRATFRVAFGAGSLILVALLTAQSMWFFSEALSERYPGLRSVLTFFCQYSGCELAKRRDPKQIHMVSRDVRIHPDYEGALRVIATMVNRLPYAQPYPRMRFTLFNVNGEVIVGRTFRPDEYLTSEVDVTAGMPSLEPVQIVLDLLALEEAAVSFEFSFL